MDEKPTKAYELPGSFENGSKSEDFPDNSNLDSTVSSTEHLIAERSNWGNPIEFILSCLR